MTSEKIIFFYRLNLETFMPELDNAMYNFMACNQMMVGGLEKYAITYKSNESSFSIFSRKCSHENMILGLCGVAVIRD